MSASIIAWDIEAVLEFQRVSKANAAWPCTLSDLMRARYQTIRSIVDTSSRYKDEWTKPHPLGQHDVI